MTITRFADKKVILAKSHVELNKYFLAITTWNGDAIGDRAEHLAETAMEVWPYFGDTQQGAAQGDGVTNRKPAAVLFFGERIPASTWRDVAQRTLEAIANRDPEMFELVAIKFPKFLADDSASLRDGRQLAGGKFMEVHLSAKGLYTSCVQVTEAAGISPEDWRVEFA